MLCQRMKLCCRTTSDRFLSAVPCGSEVVHTITSSNDFGCAVQYDVATGAARCGDYVWEQGKNAKIPASEPCFDLKRYNATTQEYDYLACAHHAPWEASRKMSRRLQQHLDSNMQGRRRLLQTVYGYQYANDFVSPAQIYNSSGYVRFSALATV